jgi:hypothetical protein
METARNLLSIARQLDEFYREISEQALIDPEGSLVGWRSYVLDKNLEPIGGGTSADRLTARRIAIAELIERSSVAQLLKNSAQRRNFKLDVIPTTSGFAAGFDRESTRFRSVCEGIERWAWSCWIDKNCLLPEISLPEFTLLGRFHTKPFLELKAYQREIAIPIQLPNQVPFQIPSQIPRVFVFSVLLGFTEQGVFAGSRVTTSQDDPWTHASIEAWRNHNNFHLTHLNQTNPIGSDWLEKRVLYFGKNKREAMEQIAKAKYASWPPLNFDISKGIEVFPGIHLWRTLCRDFLAWHKGPDHRFVY